MNGPFENASLARLLVYTPDSAGSEMSPNESSASGTQLSPFGAHIGKRVSSTQKESTSDL